jgi:hypothetical protein
MPGPQFFSSQKELKARVKRGIKQNSISGAPAAAAGAGRELPRAHVQNCWRVSGGKEEKSLCALYIELSHFFFSLWS